MSYVEILNEALTLNEQLMEDNISRVFNFLDKRAIGSPPDYDNDSTLVKMLGCLQVLCLVVTSWTLWRNKRRTRMTWWRYYHFVFKKNLT